jgi:uncharacterized membrane protein YqgA involved in biofilm formation
MRYLPLAFSVWALALCLQLALTDRHAVFIVFAAVAGACVGASIVLPLWQATLDSWERHSKARQQAYAELVAEYLKP